VESDDDDTYTLWWGIYKVIQMTVYCGLFLMMGPLILVLYFGTIQNSLLSRPQKGLKTTYLKRQKERKKDILTSSGLAHETNSTIM
jgi:hypothetical protein